MATNDVRPGATPAGADGLNPQRRRAGRVVGVLTSSRISPPGPPRTVLIERPLRRRTDRRPVSGRTERSITTPAATDDRTLAARIVAVSSFPPRTDGPTDAWLARRGSVLIEKYPPLAVVAAWRNLLSGHADEAIEMADLADRATFDEMPADGSASFESQRARLRAVMARRGPRAMLEDARRALSDEPPRSPWRAVAFVLIGQAHAALGDAEAADTAYRDAIMTGTSFAPAPAVLALAGRASLRVDQGNWGAADAFIHDSRIQLFRADLGQTAAAVLIHAVDARVALVRGDLARAYEAFARGQSVAPMATHAMPYLSVEGLLHLAQAALGCSEVGTAQTILRQSEQILRRRPDLGSLTAKLTAVRGQVEEASSSLVGSSMFTPAELRVLQFLSTHLSFQDIGDRLSVSRNTVKTHAMSIYGKLWASSRNEAVERAVQLGLLEPNPMLRATTPSSALVVLGRASTIEASSGHA